MGHFDNSSTAPTNSKGEHEDHDLCSTIQSRGHKEVVLAEPPWPVSAQVVLREHGQAEGCEDGTVDTNVEVAKSPAQDGGNDLVCIDSWPFLMNEPEWKWNE